MQVSSKNSCYQCTLNPYLVVTYFPNFLYLYMRLISYGIGYQGETKKLLTQMRFIHNWVPNKRQPFSGWCASGCWFTVAVSLTCCSLLLEDNQSTYLMKLGEKKTLVCGGWWKVPQSLPPAREECNKYDLTAAPCFSDWPIIMISPSGWLLVVSRLFAGTVLVLWVRVEKK